MLVIGKKRFSTEQIIVKLREAEIKAGNVSFEPKGLSIGLKTLANFLERKIQLYW